MGRSLATKTESSDIDHVASVGDEDAQGDGLRTGTAAEVDDPRHKHKKFKQNWRLNMLAKSREDKFTPKYVDPEYKQNTGVSPDALKAECTDRVEQMAINGMRYLKVNKTLFTPIRGPVFANRMDGYIDKSWNSIYNYYRKSLHDLKKKKAEQQQRKVSSRWSSQSADKSKGKKGKGKAGPKIGKNDSKISEKSKELLMKEFDEWCNERAKPKALIKPPPINRGPIADLDIIKPRQDELALPRRDYRTSKDIVQLGKVAPGALIYEPSDRIKEIALPAPIRLQKVQEIIPGVVKPGALLYEITDRVKTLAIPKPATTARESDLREDAFTISPGALKYVATPRMLELAKAKEYSFK